MGGRLFKKYYYILFKSIIIMILIAFSILFYNTLENINEERLERYYKTIIDDKINYSRSVINRTIQGIDIEREIVKSQQVQDVNEIVELLREYINMYRDIDFTNDPLFKSYLEKKQYCNVMVFKDDHLLFNSCQGKNLEEIVDDEYIIVNNNWTVDKSHYNTFVFVEKKIIDEIVIDRLSRRMRNSVLLDDERIYVYKIHRRNSNFEKLEIVVNPSDISSEGDYISLNENDSNSRCYRLDDIENLNESGEVIFDIESSQYDLEDREHTFIISKVYTDYDWIISVSFNVEKIENSLEEERKNINSVRGKEIILFSAILVSLVGLVYITGSIIELRDKVKNENERLIEAGKVIGSELLALRDKANLDPLTNLYNRRAIEEKFMSFMNKNQFVDYSVLMCDIDDFKIINDKNGHDIGDCVLREVALTITNTLRKEDVVSRWGGDEFLVVLFDSDKHTSMIVAEKVKKAVEDIVSNCYEIDFKLTISIGVAKSYAGLSYQEVISLADIALYKSKNAGKNCITLMER